MIEIQRVSPVSFKSSPVKTEKRDHCQVVLEYHNEGQGPFLIDLSHRIRLDLQDAEVASKKPFGLTIPEMPGESIYDKGILSNRMNRTQVSLWHLAGGTIEMPTESSYTDVTEATVFMALVGKSIFSILEKLSALDLLNPEMDAPRLFQGPVSHVPCQVVILGTDKENTCAILTCSRGYAKDMVHAIQTAGAEFGLEPAGENRFSMWLEKNLK